MTNINDDYEKHAVHTDALATLGTIIGPNEARDAIHLAVEPVVADMRIYPGDHVGFTRGGRVEVVPNNEGVGIADPFLTQRIEEGDRFWLIVYPRQITSLRHVWEHDAFPPSEVAMRPTSAADTTTGDEQRLREWLADSELSHFTFEALVEACRSGIWWGDDEWSYLKCDEFGLISGGTDAYGEVPSWVWDAMERYLGERPVATPDFIGCSC